MANANKWIYIIHTSFFYLLPFSLSTKWIKVLCFITLGLCRCSLGLSDLNIVAIFPERNYSKHADIFNNSIIQQNSRNFGNISLSGVPLKGSTGPNDTYTQICDISSLINSTAFIVFGTQNAINSAYVMTKYLGIPLMGYNTETESLSVLVSGVILLVKNVLQKTEIPNREVLINLNKIIVILF